MAKTIPDRPKLGDDVLVYCFNRVNFMVPRLGKVVAEIENSVPMCHVAVFSHPEHDMARGMKEVECEQRILYVRDKSEAPRMQVFCCHPDAEIVMPWGGDVIPVDGQPQWMKKYQKPKTEPVGA